MPSSSPPSPQPQSSAAPSSPSSPAPAAKADERKLIIDSLDVRGGEVTVAATVLQGRTLKTTLPPLHLADIGRKEGGATPAEATELIITAITDQAQKTAPADLRSEQRRITAERAGNTGVGGSARQHL